MEKMIEINFAGQLTESEFRQIQKLAMKKLWLIAGIVLIMLPIFFLLNEGLDVIAADPVTIFIAWIPVIILIPFLIILRRFTLRRHWRNNRVIQLPVSGSISDEGISWNVQGLSSTKIPWHLLLKYRTSNSLVLIYQSLNQVFYFPRRYFANDTEWNIFLEFLAKKLPRK